MRVKGISKKENISFELLFFKGYFRFSTKFLVQLKKKPIRDHTDLFMTIECI